MTNFEGLYDIRSYRPSDYNFIAATMLRGLYYGDSWFSQMDKDSFMLNYGKIVRALVDKSSVRVACLKDDQDTILGYTILSKDLTTAHWVFVKAVWRNKGIARSLIPKDITTVTHLTKLGASLLTKTKAIFDPFKI